MDMQALNNIINKNLMLVLLLVSLIYKNTRLI